MGQGWNTKGEQQRCLTLSYYLLFCHCYLYWYFDIGGKFDQMAWTNAGDLQLTPPRTSLASGGRIEILNGWCSMGGVS